MLRSCSVSRIAVSWDVTPYVLVRIGCDRHLVYVPPARKMRTAVPEVTLSPLIGQAVTSKRGPRIINIHVS